MKVVLRKMTLQEYNSFYEYSVNNHANELMREMNISFEDALNKTEAELKEMLPADLDTVDNTLMVIEESTEGRNVGFMWYLYEEIDGIKQVFLSDFVIKKDERRKGYATAALNQMKMNAKEYDCKESVLFVSKDNISAIKLYSSCGYIPFREYGDGIYMKMQI